MKYGTCGGVLYCNLEQFLSGYLVRRAGEYKTVLVKGTEVLQEWSIEDGLWQCECSWKSYPLSSEFKTDCFGFYVAWLLVRLEYVLPSLRSMVGLAIAVLPSRWQHIHNVELVGIVKKASKRHMKIK